MLQSRCSSSYVNVAFGYHLGMDHILIDKLGPDILSIIFLEIMHSHNMLWEERHLYRKAGQGWYKTRTGLLLVSRHWNQFLIASPLLWVDVVANVGDLNMAHLCLQRSAQPGVYMDICFLSRWFKKGIRNFNSLASAMLATICDTGPRWTYIRISYGSGLIPIFPPFLDGRLSQLAKLDITGFFDIENPIGKEFGSSVFASALHLRSLTMEYQPAGLLNLPPQLHHISIKGSKSPISMVVQDIVNMHSLRTLTLGVASADVFSNYRGSKVCFPSLVALSLELDWMDDTTNRDLDAIGAFLSNLDVPLLGAFTLSCGMEMEMFRSRAGAGKCIQNFLCRLPALKKIWFANLDVSSQDLLSWLSAVTCLTSLSILCGGGQHVPLAPLFQRLCIKDNQFLPLLDKIHMHGLYLGDITVNLLTSLVTTRGLGRHNCSDIVQLRQVDIAFDCEQGDIEGLDSLDTLAEVVSVCRGQGCKVSIMVLEDRADYPDMTSEDYWNNTPTKPLV